VIRRSDLIVSLARRGFVCALVIALGGCVTNQTPLDLPPPYMLLPVDEMMSCDAISASFHFAARRAARLEYWLAVGPLPGYGFDRFPIDAPQQLVDERRRLDALTDMQRYKGCTVLAAGPAVVYERWKLEEAAKRTPAPVLK
jgi:hypothetical protein